MPANWRVQREADLEKNPMSLLEQFAVTTEELSASVVIFSGRILLDRDLVLSALSADRNAIDGAVNLFGVSYEKTAAGISKLAANCGAEHSRQKVAPTFADLFNAVAHLAAVDAGLTGTA